MAQFYTHIFSGLEARAFLREHNFKPSQTSAQISFELIDGLSETSLTARAQSFLTHSTRLENQIRFPLPERVERSFKSLAADLFQQGIHISIEKIELHHLDTVSIEFFRSLGIAVLQIDSPSQHSHLLNILNQDELNLLEFLKNPRKNLAEILSFAQKRIYSCDYRTALNIFNLVEIEYLDRADFYYLKGLCHNYFNQTELSEVCFEKMRQIGSPEVKANAGYVLSMLYLRLHPQELQDLNRAETYLEDAYHLLQSLPSTENSIFQTVFNRNGYALCLYRKGLVHEAVEMLERGISQLRAFKNRKHDLHQSVLLYNALQCYRTLKRYSDCERTTRELLALDPLFPEYHLEHGKTLLEQSKFSEARKYFRHAAQLDPLIAEAHALIAYSYFAEDNFALAALYYRAALKLKPHSLQFQEDAFYCESQLASEACL